MSMRSYSRRRSALRRARPRTGVPSRPAILNRRGGTPRIEMPFARHSAYSFSKISVQKNAPPSGGIYGLSNAQGWIYIHAADNIQAALLNHLGHIDPLADFRGATG